MAVTLQLPSDTPSFQVDTQLDGVLYRFDFRWNSRDEQWAFDLADSAGDPIVSGVAVVVDFPLMRRANHDPRLPRGCLTAVDTGGLNVDPGLTDLGPDRRVQLVYFTEAEFDFLLGRGPRP